MEKEKSPANRRKQEGKGPLRDGRGRFVKGESGNPQGRPGIPAELRQYGREAPMKLLELAEAAETPLKVRADIYKWFAEMSYGKPGQQVDLSGQVNNHAVTTVRFEGELGEWAK